MARKQLGTNPSNSNDLVTKSYVDSLSQASTTTGAFASMPTAGSSGRLYLCTDTDAMYRDNGTSWDRVSFGNGGTNQPVPPSSGWTSVNIGTATTTVERDSIKFVGPSNGSTDSMRAQVRTLSPSSNYTATAYFEYHAATANYHGPSGLVLRNSSSGSMISFGMGWGTNTTSTGSYVRAVKYTGATTYNSDYGSLAQAGMMGLINWYRIRDDGTNRYFEYSYNGVDWITFISVGRTDYITPDQIGWGVIPYSIPVTLRLRAWSVA